LEKKHINTIKKVSITTQYQERQWSPVSGKKKKKKVSWMEIAVTGRICKIFCEKKA
jgi:hypothetical protein